MKSIKSLPGTKRFIVFMMERHMIYIRRFVKKQKPPYTKDPILQMYSFTNIYRELDRVTIWIRKNIREPFKDHPHLWFMLCMARQINWPDTLQELMHPVKDNSWPFDDKWNYRKTMSVMRARKKRGDKLYTGAYILNAQYKGFTDKKIDKAEFTCKYVLNSLWRDRFFIEPYMHGSIEEAVAKLMEYPGWGGFTAYEVACDLRYTRYLKNAKDKLTYANAGPGAQRGLNRIFERELRSQQRASKTLEEMVALLPVVQSKWPDEWPRLELREIEHSLCEFDKYERTRLGEGRPRSKFKPVSTGSER